MANAAAIIVAAGRSRRMGFNKLTALLAGRPVLWHSLRAFQLAAGIEEIVLVADGEAAALGQEWIQSGEFSKLSGIVPGGAERWLSVRNGCEALRAGRELVAVHDGARPLIEPEQIDRCLAAAGAGNAAVSARAVTETLKRADSDGFIIGSLPREGAWVMETPQVAPLAALKRSFLRCERDALTPTDEVSALQFESEKFPVKVVPNQQLNVKITFPGDLALAETWLQARSEAEKQG